MCPSSLQSKGYGQNKMISSLNLSISTIFRPFEKDGSLLNNKDELAAALRNINKVSDSEGESEIEDSDADENSENEDETETLENENLDETLENDDLSEDAADSVHSDSGEVKISQILEDDDEKDFVGEKVPTMTAVMENASTALSSDKNFRKTLSKYSNSDKISFLSALARKILTGTDAQRPLKMKSLFEYSVLLTLRNEIFDEEGKSIAPILFELAEKCPATAFSMTQMIKEFADKDRFKISKMENKFLPKLNNFKKNLSANRKSRRSNSSFI